MRTLEGAIQKLGGILRAHEERLRDVENALADVIKERDDLKKRVTELEDALHDNGVYSNGKPRQSFMKKNADGV